MNDRGRGSMSGDAEAVRIRLLGGFRVSVGERTIEAAAWHLRKAANLVKLLALAPGYRLHREQRRYCEETTTEPGLGQLRVG